MENISSESFIDVEIESTYSCSSCCSNNKQWCFEHSGIAAFRDYDSNKWNCCTCLDCCTWCLEFRCKKYSFCARETNCYLCCFAIYFT